MAAKDWLIGTLRPDGYLMTESGKILLTTLPKGAPQLPEAATLPVAEEDLSKTALVRGCLVGNVLYSAQVVETLPRLTGALIQKLAEKGVVSLPDRSRGSANALWRTGMTHGVGMTERGHFSKVYRVF